MDKRREYDKQLSSKSTGTDTLDSNYINQLSKDIDELIGSENYTDAKMLADRLVEVNPKDPTSWIKMANVQKSMQQYEKAIEYYQKAVDVDPSNIDAFVGLGFSYTKLNQVDPSLRYYNQALKLDDNSIAAHAGYAHIQQFIGNYDDSIKHYERVAEIAGGYPTDLAHLIAKVYFDKGESYLPHDQEDASYYYYIGEDNIESFIKNVEKAESIYSQPMYQEEIKKAKKSLGKTYDWGKITLLTLPLFFIEMSLIVPFAMFVGILYLSFRPRWVIRNRTQFGNRTTFDTVSSIYTKTVGALIIFVIGVGLSLGGVATLTPSKYKD